ncbi:hypothetical protein ACHQM5_015762 [Ranunculus cassubicifolius]
MASNNYPETCAEHKLAIEDNKVGEIDRVDIIQRGQWLRAAILGSNDGLLSTTSLMLGMAAASEDKRDMILSGLAAAIAGACSMAVGEYVSVATQRDIEKMEFTCSTESSTKVNFNSLPGTPIVAAPEKLKHGGASPGMQPTLGMSPARRSVFMSPQRSPMMRVIAEEAREQVKGDGYEALPDPIKAGAASALSFLCGAIIPLLTILFIYSHTMRVIALIIVTTIALGIFGGVGAYLGGSPIRVSATRVLIGGWVSMAISYGLLKPFGRKHGEGNNSSG